MECGDWLQSLEVVEWEWIGCTACNGWTNGMDDASRCIHWDMKGQCGCMQDG